MQESTNEGINKWNNKLMFLSLAYSIQKQSINKQKNWKKLPNWPIFSTSGEIYTDDIF